MDQQALSKGICGEMGNLHWLAGGPKAGLRTGLLVLAH
jgi:hypothetical protein